MPEDQKQQAFILRIAPTKIDLVPVALQSDQLIIGWAYAEGLLEPTLDWEHFRKIVSDAYYSKEPNLRRAGAAAGQMWRFIQDMKIADLVVVPHWSDFYVAKASGPAIFDESKQEDDTAYRRPATWLNGKRPIPRSVGRSALISRMKIQQPRAAGRGVKHAPSRRRRRCCHHNY
jgi:predicted Mrr-cat superfamily restriction endonuclease